MTGRADEFALKNRFLNLGARLLYPNADVGRVTRYHPPIFVKMDLISRVYKIEVGDFNILLLVSGM